MKKQVTAKIGIIASVVIIFLAATNLSQPVAMFIALPVAIIGLSVSIFLLRKTAK